MLLRAAYLMPPLFTYLHCGYTLPSAVSKTSFLFEFVLNHSAVDCSCVPIGLLVILAESVLSCDLEVAAFVGLVFAVHPVRLPCPDVVTGSSKRPLTLPRATWLLLGAR